MSQKEEMETQIDLDAQEKAVTDLINQNPQEAERIGAAEYLSQLQ
jgi:hypothetical protein